jgi:hypothetical protein
MIGTTQAVILVAAEPQRHAAMGAEFVHDPDAALAVAERDQPFAQKLQADWRAIRLGNLRRQQRRNPISADEISYRRSGSGAREKIILFAGRHDACDGSRDGACRQVRLAPFRENRES